jgi:ribosome biogenesis GTPase / thiamine phosphate phosphatase
MPKHSESLIHQSKGTVTTATRRHVNVLLDSELTLEVKEHRARCMRKAADVVVGDRVSLQEIREELTVTEVAERENSLLRSYFSRTKLLAANLNCIFVVTAPAPLFNSLFVDKVLAFAHVEGIEPVLIMNKADIGDEDYTELIELYKSLGYTTLLTSCKKAGGLDELTSFIEKQATEHANDGDSKLAHMAFCGVSGVGKSSLLNVLLPEIKQRTSEVNDKTGQGKQTTSQGWGYVYQLESGTKALLTDLPGVQNFGVSKLEASSIAHAFPEFFDARTKCEYSDCRHLLEPNCGVKTALDEGKIAESRYESYYRILEEIESARPY